MKFLFPLPVNSNWVETQSYDEHVARAKQLGCCPKPGVNCRCFYFGGIDWGVPNGTKVFAAADGTIERATSDASGYGMHVRISHAENILTVYGHLKSVTVNKGDKVKQGDLIGYSNNTGNSSGPHLHFEARQSNVPFDPEPYLIYEVDPNPEPEPTPDNPWTKLQFPDTYPVAETQETMAIRTVPTTDGNTPIAYTGIRRKYEFYKVQLDDIGRTWIKIGNERWFCVRGSDGTIYAKLVS